MAEDRDDDVCTGLKDKQTFTEKKIVVVSLSLMALVEVTHGLFARPDLVSSVPCIYQGVMPRNAKA